MSYPPDSVSKAFFESWDVHEPRQSRKPPRPPPDVTWKHRWTNDQVQDGLSESHFGELPNEILLQIFQHLNVYELGQISLVCRAFKMVADNDEIWKVKCNTQHKLASKSYKEVYMEWIYEKHLRNAEVQHVAEIFLEEMEGMGCGIRCGPPHYPVRPKGTVTFDPIGGFAVHPNASQDLTIQFSVDVVKTAPELISLLEKASRFQQQWQSSTVIQQMIKRYFRFMQLKASHPPNLLLIPTLDIEIVWQTHLLRPSMYRDDCLRLFHRVIDHSLLTDELEQFLKDQAFLDTCQLYEERYGEEYCPKPTEEMRAIRPTKYVFPIFCPLKCLIPVYSYWDETSYDFASTIPRNYGENPFSFTEADILLDGNWLSLCHRFMNNAISKVPIQREIGDVQSDQIDLTEGPLNRLVKSYERFLYMATKYPPTNGYGYIHPTYAIDIVWHSHMQEPLKYASDCQRLVGYLIDHAPWPSVDGTKMKEACGDTMKAWKDEFQVDMLTDHLYNTKEDYQEPWVY